MLGAATGAKRGTLSGTTGTTGTASGRRGHSRTGGAASGEHDAVFLAGLVINMGILTYLLIMAACIGAFVAVIYFENMWG